MAVLTELITKGQVGNGTEPMLAYGKRIVMQRFGSGAMTAVVFGMSVIFTAATRFERPSAPVR